MCREEELILLANGRLSGIAAWRARRHVQHCGACRSALAELTALGAELRGLAQATPSEALDFRMQTRRYENETRTVPFVNLMRLPAPLVGAMLGLCFGLYNSMPGPTYFETTAHLKVTQSPKVENIEVGQQLIRMLVRYQGGSRTLAGGFYRQSEISGDQARLAYSVTGTHSKQEVVESLRCLESAPLLKKLGWRVKVDPQTVTQIPMTRPSRWPTVLWAMAVGALLGGLFWVLRLLGGSLPGGPLVALGVGVILGVMGGLAHSFTTRNHYQAALTVQFTNREGSGFVDEWDSYKVVDVIPTSTLNMWLRSVTSLKPAGRVRLVFQSSDRDPQVVWQGTKKWSQKLVDSKVVKLLGYKVKVVEPVSMGEDLDQRKYQFLFCVLCGTVAGLVMGLFRRR